MMSPSFAAFKSFGPLFHLTLDLPELYYFDLKTSKSFCYSSITDQVLETDTQHEAITSLPVKDHLEQFGTLSVTQILKEKEIRVLELLVHEMGIKIGLMLASEKAEFYGAMLNKLHDGIVACDENGILKFFNQKTIELHGLPDKPLPAEAWAASYDIYHTDGISRMDKKDIPLYRALHGEKVEGAEMVIAPKNKDKINILSYAETLLNSEGDKIGALASMREESQLKKELEKVDSRFKTIFYQSPLSIQICTNDGMTILVNPAWKELWGIPEEVIQNYILKDYNMLKDPLLEQQGVMEYIKRGYSGETTKIPVIRYDAKESGLEGRERYVEGLIYPLKDNFGNVTEIVLIHIDVTEKKKLEQSQTILTNVSSILNTSLEYEKTIAQFAEACVPQLAEGCLIELIEGDRVNRVVTKHKDPKVQLLLEGFDTPHLSSKVLRTGIPELVTEVENSEQGELILKTSLNSYMAVPIIIRSRVIGAISFLMTSGKASFNELNLETALELAKRASYAIENSRLYRQLQQAIHLRDEFISLASHELKTPISSMKLQFQIFERELKKNPEKPLDGKSLEKVVTTSNKQLNRINRLVDDMLDISRISSGKLYLHLEKCNLGHVVNDVIKQLSLEHEEVRKNITLNIEANVEALCDQVRIEQVLTNLVTNAIRHGGGKGMEVSMKNHDGMIIIRVADHGPGISPKDQERVFGRFERATSINISGLGLGLYISRKIMEQHHGTLELESSKGAGSVFTAAFPARLN